MVTKESVFEHYWRKGWAIVEDVFKAQEVDRIAALAVRIAEEEYVGLEAGYLVDLTDEGTLAPRKIDGAFLRDQLFRDLLLDQRLRGYIEHLAGHKPLLLGDAIFMKPPRCGSAKPYHQDNFYFRCHPADQVVTAWIALDDADIGNGCLHYIDGSHRWPVLPHYAVRGEAYNSAPPAELIDVSKESPAPVRKGGVVFHHSQTLHTSRRNESDRWRRGYASHWITCNVTSENGTLDAAYFKREEFRHLFT